MKKRIVFLFLSGVLFTTSYSQNTPSNKFEFGIEGGPNMTVMYGTSTLPIKTGIGFGFIGGAAFQINFNKLLAFRTNVSFERKVDQLKGKVIYTDEYGKIVGTGKTHSNLDYLVIPLLVRLNVGDQVKFFANIGPYFGLLLQAKTIVNIPEEPKIKSSMKGGEVDVGVTVGAGISIPIQDRFALTFEARNNLGFLPVFKGGKLKTNSTNLLIGFSYGIPGR